MKRPSLIPNIQAITVLCALCIYSASATTSYPKSFGLKQYSTSQNFEWYGYMAGDLYLGAVDALQAEPNNDKSACWIAGDITREEIYIVVSAVLTEPTVLLNNFQILQIKVQNTIEACALKIMINFIDSRMSNLDYTLGIISNIISQTASGFVDENEFVDKVGSNSLTNEIVTLDGPSIAVYQSLNFLWITYQADIINYLNNGKAYPDFYLMGFYFSKLIAGLLNFKSPNVSADLAAD